MEPTLFRLEPQRWAEISEGAHQVAFGYLRPPHLDRISFALVVGDASSPRAFATVIEMDADTAYMQHGGAMPSTLGTTGVRRDYREIVDYLKARYRRISTRIHNGNVAMLKLAMNEGLRINGCDIYEDGVYLNLMWGFK